MRFLSLFSGCGGFDKGLEMAGLECVGQVEIDKDRLRVLEEHWPDVRRWTDVRGVGLGRGADHERDEPHDAQADPTASEPDGTSVDLVCGGFPCEDLSVAGQRAGLDGARSGLWFEFQRILSELRPRWALIENVPGLLSSNQGRDFAVVLDGLGECGFGGIGWAVLDSQHFGVAQRRRRVFVVAGPTRRGVEQVLALCESCAGHPAQSRTPGEDVAATLRGRARGSGSNAPGRGGEDDVKTAQTGANGVGVQDDTVRRLTPVECCRLQGFPDDWLDLSPALSDGAKYRMLGNAVTVPVIEWIGARLREVDERERLDAGEGAAALRAPRPRADQADEARAAETRERGADGDPART